MGGHQFQEGQGIGDVVAIVLQRFADGFVDVEQRGKVQDGVEAAFGQGGFQETGVGQVTDDQPGTMIDRFGVPAVDQIIVHHDGMAGVAQGPHAVAPNISGPAGDEEVHARLPRNVETSKSLNVADGSEIGASINLFVRTVSTFIP